MIPFVGPAYSLANYKASAQDSVNLYLIGLETPSKAPFLLERVPGLSSFVDLGAEIRGAIECEDRLFVVAGPTLYEVNSAGTATIRGTIQTSTGTVDMAWGLSQLVIVDGANGYVLTLATNAFSQITDPDFPGSETVAFLNNYFYFVSPDTQQVYASAINDATTFDALDYVSAERSPDRMVAVVNDHAEVLFFGSRSIERWVPSVGDFPLQRDNGTAVDVGCLAPHSIRAADNTLFFLGRDKAGSGIVYRMGAGIQPVRVSTTAVEESIGEGTLADSTAWVYQDRGQTFYCLQVPGVDATWVYETTTGTWHKRCDLDEFGQFVAWRADHGVFAHGKHLVGGADGIVYEMSRTYRTFAGDAIVCERTSPHSASPNLEQLRFSAFILDALTGEADQSESPVVELSWSNDGGATYGNPLQRSLGAVGERFPRIVWRALGVARNRVWKVRYTDAAKFSILNATVQ